MDNIKQLFKTIPGNFEYLNTNTCLNDFLGKKSQLISVCIVLSRIDGSGLRTYKRCLKNTWKDKWFLEPNEVEVLRGKPKRATLPYMWLVQ